MCVCVCVFGGGGGGVMCVTAHYGKQKSKPPFAKTCRLEYKDSGPEAVFCHAKLN